MSVGTLTNAIGVARYLVSLAAGEDEPECLSPMRLQKLLYYAQGWSLAERNAPLFKEQIEAWAHGPVVPEVYQTFKGFGRVAIPETEAAVDALSQEDSEFVSRVWDAYKGYSAISLSDMTHAERPWNETRGGLAREARCERTIPPELMREYFRSCQSNGDQTK